MGKLYDLIQEHIDAQPYPVSDRKIAEALEVSPTTLSNWRTPKKLIARKHVVAIARLTKNPYRVVLEALLQDIGYAEPGPASPGPGSPGATDQDATIREIR